MVEMRCGGKGGRCGTLVATVKDYFGHLVLVEHLLSDKKTPLDLHGGIGMAGCRRHGERLPGAAADHHWLEQHADVDLEHAAQIAVDENRTIRVPVSAQWPHDEEE